MADENEAFGELRALMNARIKEHAWWRDLQALLDAAIDRDLEVVRDRWAPYIRGFGEVWSRRFEYRRLTTLEDFERWPVAFSDLRFELYLYDQRVGDDAVEQILSAPQAERMTELNLGRCRLTWRGYESLAASTRLTSLRRLTLATNAPGARGARALAEMECLSRLERLNVYANDLDDASVAAIVRAVEGAALRHLELSTNTVGVEATAALCEARGLGSLERLRLDDTSLGDGGALALCGARGLGSLELLSVERCGITARGARALIEGLKLPSLRWLMLERNAIPPEDEGELSAAANARGFEAKLRRVEYTDWR